MKQGIITKTCAVAAALAMGVSLAACGGSSADSDKGHVYFMNNKAEVVDQYKQLAEMYTEKTGVQVDVQTGASNTYDATMSSELAKSNAPTTSRITRRSRPWPSPSTSTRTISASTARSRRQVWMPPTHTVSPRIWGASRCTTSTRT